MRTNGRDTQERELDEVVQDATPCHRQRHSNSSNFGGTKSSQPWSDFQQDNDFDGDEERIVDKANVCAQPVTIGGYARAACVGGLAAVGSLQLICLAGIKHTAVTKMGHLTFEFVSVTLLQEALKLIIACVCLHSLQTRTNHAPHKSYPAKPSSQFLLFCVPAALFCFETNFQYIILDFLKPVELTILWNFKICATAGLLRVFLRRRYSWQQWFAIMVLVTGCVVPEVATHLTISPSAPTRISGMPQSEVGIRRNTPHTMMKPENVSLGQAPDTSIWGWGVLLSTKFIGTLLAIVGSSVAAAGNVTSEWLLKQNPEESIHSKNAKQYFFGVLFNLATLIVKAGPNPGSPVRGPDGIVTGFNVWVWTIVILGATSGLIVSGVLRYLDNIAVVFAHALAMIFVAVVSAELFDQVLSPPFIFGGVLVTVAMLTFYAEDARPWTDVTKAPSKLAEQ